jgi:uncharacterized protein YjbI with pentapeptide repeats
MHATREHIRRTLRLAAALFPVVALTTAARADIYQWEYIEPADPSQGKQQSTTLAPDGANVDAVPGADFSSYNLTKAFLIGADLTGARGPFSKLTDADLSRANLKNAVFRGATLSNAEFTGADVRGASFAKDLSCYVLAFPCLLIRSGTGITAEQLYSTASFKAHDLSGIHLGANNLNGWNFAGQNLTNSEFGTAWFNITTSRLEVEYATLTGANLTAADARGAGGLIISDASTTNLIWPDGHISGLDLDAGGLIVRDYDGVTQIGLERPPIPITVDEHLTMGPGGTLRMVFEADAWDSTISFAPGIPVMLGGTLELSFAADVNPASQIGRTFDLFDWTGVNPTGTFAVSSPYSWDLSNLYTTGDVTLTAVPEPDKLLLIEVALISFAWVGRARIRSF